MTPVERAVPVGASTVTTRRYPAENGARGRLVLAHGAGADQRHRVMVAIASRLAARGVEVVTFNFLYTEQRRRTPDRAPVLEQTWEAVVDAVADDLSDGQRLVIGGKSMGGRMASMVLARTPDRPSWARVSGLVLLGYPLHPPGKPDQPRTAHLPSIRVPEPKDIYATSSYDDNALVQPESRQAFRQLLGQGWVDALRKKRPRETVYTFWDYRRNRWQRDAGLRLDHILLSRKLARKLEAAGVDREVRGLENASDHAPVWVQLRD